MHTHLMTAMSLVTNWLFTTLKAYRAIGCLKSELSQETFQGENKASCGRDLSSLLAFIYAEEVKVVVLVVVVLVLVVLV